jgi:hypothetical protein
MQVIKLTKEKNGPALRAILMAVRIRWYGAECIAQYGRSRATLEQKCSSALFLMDHNMVV